MLRSLAVLAFLPLLPVAATADTFSADVWADNWFDMRINGVLVAEDSVPITTERSFNAESFQFETERPFVVGIVAKDFKENDTGLEYIGTRRQQMGDGGIIFQIKDAMGADVAVSDDALKCLVIHSAPLDKSCAQESDPQAGDGLCTFQALEAPVNWDQPGFDASDWPQAHVYSEQEVRPKDGYDKISWSSNAKLIWGPDLEQSNTMLCRFTVK
ncbi:PEBP family protein [Cohaesibacter celericrescens]|uniref:PEBP family protein n=1 Tax=Cohaesibacter celericrescens TaxID=2067669 RepID=A0A2N5XMX8_9HYPH|nr:PEBP family protein [Cohaesibacter celericrescens]PLW75767.1 PEBP family protein [Cohaesibacter celericrescens]